MFSKDPLSALKQSRAIIATKEDEAQQKTCEKI